MSKSKSVYGPNPRSPFESEGLRWARSLPLTPEEPILWLSEVEIIPENKQSDSASIIPLKNEKTGDIIGYRARMGNGFTRDVTSIDHAHALVRFMLVDDLGTLGLKH